MWVKVCGLRDPESVAAAAEAGADAIGFVFAPGSPRVVDATLARSLISGASGTLTVGVFRNQPIAEVIRTAAEAGVDAVQLHGSESAVDHEAVRAAGWPTIRAMAAREYTAEVDAGAHPSDYLLLDAPEPGAGELFDGAYLAQRPPSRPWVLAGGLEPGNVAGRIRELRPWGVDVSSGVETAPGRKSPALIARFVAAARGGFEQVEV
ncbi:phosphoribosylanthranilate isomerase [Leifsonia sp. NPDC058230]|uniref:phosphoribosylanthranilate isomerase n=1 Tax=Leifsonia sp. NPDC058230 TaxID=3346391 RepID=UPI0036DA4C8F